MADFEWKISSSGNRHIANHHIQSYLISWSETFIFIYMYLFCLFNSYLFYFYSFYSLFPFFNAWGPQQGPMQSLTQTQSILVIPM